MSQAGGDPKRLQRATVQPDGHAVVVGEGFLFFEFFFLQICILFFFCEEIVLKYIHTLISHPFPH